MTCSGDYTVVVLGAGCSCDYGYPLGAKMLEHLRDFAADVAVGQDCAKLSACVRETLKTFDQARQIDPTVSTLDELVALVDRSRLTAFGRDRDAIVGDAKRAVAAMFLHREARSAKAGLHGYINLLNRVFPPGLGTWDECQRATRFRVLSFNYDRLFEIAFRQRYGSHSRIQNCFDQDALNMGLQSDCTKPIEVAPDRFAYLKLHGTVGVFATEENSTWFTSSAPRVLHNRVSDIPFAGPLDDQLVCDDTGKGKHPLIAFPHEKPQLAEYPDNRLPFREYIPAIWKRAHEIVATATSIEFVGYSFPDADLYGENSLMSLLQSAKSCRQIVVRNIDPQRVADRIEDAFPRHHWKILLRKGSLFDR